MSADAGQSGPGQQRRGPRAARMEPPPLARYLPLVDYFPEIGDFVIWAGWFRTWYGVIADISADGGTVTIIWEGLPFLLFTLTESEQKSVSRPMKLDYITGAKPGNIAVMKHDAQHNTPIWYV